MRYSMFTVLVVVINVKLRNIPGNAVFHENEILHEKLSIFL